MSAIIGIFAPEAGALDRCRDYVPDVRAQHVRHFGVSFPWWYGLGQLQTESGCRADVTAFDCGQGIAQFMPKTVREVRAAMGDGSLDPYNPIHAIRMQAFYMARLNRENEDGALAWTYQAYNGGWVPLKAEARRAGSWNRGAMRDACIRKKIRLASGRFLDFCEVNYAYAERVHDRGGRYRTGPDRGRYW